MDEINDIPYMFDTNHLTVHGADQTVDLILGDILKKILI